MEVEDMSPNANRVNAPLAENKKAVYRWWLEHDGRVMSQRHRDLALCLTEGGEMSRYAFGEILIVARSLQEAAQTLFAGQGHNSPFGSLQA